MRRMVPNGIWLTALVLTVVLTATACGKKKAPIARPTAPPPPTADTVPGASSGATEAVRDATIVPPEPVRDEAVSSAFTRRFEPQFAVTTGILRTRQQRSVRRGSARARWQCRRAQTARTWTITIEGHCDERGSAEYNLALGERRALVGPRVSGFAGTPGRPAAHGQLWQGVSVRSGT